MADSKVSAFTAATAIDDADLLPIIQGGVDKVGSAGLMRTSADLRTLPPIGWITLDPSTLSTGAGTALVQNRVTFARFPLQAGTYDAMFYNVTTASSGGAGLAASLGLYADDGSGWWPNCGAGLLASATGLSLSSTGLKTGTLGSAVVLTRPAVLWGAFWYGYTSAPTTAPILTCINNNLQTWPRPTANGVNVIRGWCLTGQSALPTVSPTTATMVLSGNNDIPALAIRRSA